MSAVGWVVVAVIGLALYLKFASAIGRRLKANQPPGGDQ